MALRNHRFLFLQLILFFSLSSHGALGPFQIVVFSFLSPPCLRKCELTGSNLVLVVVERVIEAPPFSLCRFCSSFWSLPTPQLLFLPLLMDPRITLFFWFRHEPSVSQAGALCQRLPSLPPSTPSSVPFFSFRNLNPFRSPLFFHMLNMLVTLSCLITARRLFSRSNARPAASPCRYFVFPFSLLLER